MKAWVLILLFVVCGCSTTSREQAVWKVTVTSDGVLGPLRQARPEAVRQAAGTFEQFLSELDARYYDDINLGTVTLYAMQGVLARLNAHGEVTHLDAPPPCKSDIGIGVTLTRDYHNNIIVSHLASTSPVTAAGIRAGARIIAVDDISTNLLTSSETAERITCNGKETVTLQVEQDSVIRTVEIQKQKNNFDELISLAFPGDIHYLWISSLGEFRIASRAIAMLEGARATPQAGIILDLRSMNGGFVTAGKVLLTMLLPPDSVALWYNDGPVKVPALRTPLPNPVVILTNSRTASLGEVLAMALQDHDRAIVIGEQTAGFGTALGEVTLPDHSTAYIPHVIYRGPKGAEIEGTGVTPDILVRDTSPYGYYHAGMPDAIMAAALAYLRGDLLQYTRAPH